MSQMTPHKFADLVAWCSIPANAVLWTVLDHVELLFRLFVSMGSAILVAFALWAKLRGLWSKP